MLSDQLKVCMCKNTRKLIGTQVDREPGAGLRLLIVRNVEGFFVAFYVHKQHWESLPQTCKKLGVNSNWLIREKPKVKCLDSDQAAPCTDGCCCCAE